MSFKSNVSVSSARLPPSWQSSSVLALARSIVSPGFRIRAVSGNVAVASLRSREG